jgi:hypothetical protein
MLQPITFTVTQADGSGVAVTASAPDYVAYEQRFNRSVLEGLSGGLWSVYMFVLWHAMDRQSLTDLSWEAWLDTSPVFQREVKAEEPVPLEPAQPPGPSPDSP